ncbi:MAG: CGNR zinc finger domain-containing protein [Candidatus Limnocylindrales bacterium]
MTNLSAEPAIDAHDIPHGHQVSLETGLDFINTLELERGSWRDDLTGPEVGLAWLSGHNLMHPDARRAELAHIAAEPAYGEKLLSRVRRTRAAMRGLVEASVERRSPSRSDLTEVNRALRTHYVTVLVPSTDGVTMGHRHEGDPIDGAMARLTESIARYLGEGKIDRLRVCANESCAWAFFDSSRTGRRKWCDMNTCGNRAKAARHRERLKIAIMADTHAEQAPAHV